MLVKALKPVLPLFQRGRRHERRRHAGLSPIPALRTVVSKPSVEDWSVKYPCTRMHGAAFESDFYAQDHALPG